MLGGFAKKKEKKTDLCYQVKVFDSLSNIDHQERPVLSGL